MKKKTIIKVRRPTTPGVNLSSGRPVLGPGTTPKRKPRRTKIVSRISSKRYTR
jgi:hypothetical protein